MIPRRYEPLLHDQFHVPSNVSGPDNPAALHDRATSRNKMATSKRGEGQGSQAVVDVEIEPLLRQQCCIVWSEGLSNLLRDGKYLVLKLPDLIWSSDSRVMLSSAAVNKEEIIHELCAPSSFFAMSSLHTGCKRSRWRWRVRCI